MADWHELEIPGNPTPQPRPQVIGMGAPCQLCGKRPHTRVVPGKGKSASRNLKWRQLVRNHALEAGVSLMPEVPLAVELEFFLRPPKSLLRVNGELRGSARTMPTGARSGDWDNLAKGPIDELQDVIWTNDSSIVDARARKSWALGDKGPGLLLRWREM